MIEYFARDGQPLDQRSWALMFEDRAYQRVAQTVVGDRTVSTVWLGLDHSFRPLVPEGTRHTYETMVLAPDDDELDDWTRRWCTDECAEIGHRATIAWLLNEGPEPTGCYGWCRRGELANPTPPV